VDILASDRQRKVCFARQPREQAREPGPQFVIGDLQIEQREIQIFLKPIIRRVHLLDGRPAFEGQAVSQGRFGDGQQCPREQVILFDGFITQAEAMGNFGDFTRENHIRSMQPLSECPDRC
jgi:hypothetical protein